MDVSAATTVAEVTCGIVDARAHRLVGFRVTGDAPVLPLGSVRNLGTDAVAIDGSDALHQPESDVEQRVVDNDLDPIGRRVLTDAGVELGVVQDIEFDPSDGSIRGTLVGGGEVPGGDLIGLGSYAVVVRDGAR